MLESALALSRKYQVDLGGILLHITDLLGRFTNAALKDTCQRVGGDPARKLSPADRMIGSSLTAISQGITPVYISVGTAAAVYRYIRESEQPEQSAERALEVLQNVAGLEADSALTKLILSYYDMVREGAKLPVLLAAADEQKRRTLGNVI